VPTNTERAAPTGRIGALSQRPCSSAAGNAEAWSSAVHASHTHVKDRAKMRPHRGIRRGSTSAVLISSEGGPTGNSKNQASGLNQHSRVPCTQAAQPAGAKTMSTWERGCAGRYYRKWICPE
jgi:hypothetical protein